MEANTHSNEAQAYYGNGLQRENFFAMKKALDSESTL